MAKISIQNNPESKSILSFPLEGKTVLWLREINNYIIAENEPAELIVKIVEGSSTPDLVKFCINKFDVSKEDAEALVEDYQRVISEKLSTSEVTGIDQPTLMHHRDAVNFYSKKYYRINDTVFSVAYETEYAEFLNHPKFAHHGIEAPDNCSHKVKVFDSGEWMSLVIDDKLIDSWQRQENHFLTGKFSMEILQMIHGNDENNWLGVLHAAGISDGNKCIIFFGDSGNGKSTLSAILMANGYKVLADDFLPIEKEHNLVCKFPSAISVKKEAFDLLMPIFPQLRNAEQYENPVFNKTFRYLAQDDSELIAVPAVALVFVKYSKDSGFNLEEFSKIEALTHLIPDAWIEPSPENAKRFIQWISTLKCYRLTYSDNDKLVSFVSEALKNS